MANEKKAGGGKSAPRRNADPIDLINLEERRRWVRQPTFKAAEIVLDDGVKIDCILRNISDSGCLIKLDNAQALPLVLAIRIDRGAPPRAVEIVWRSTTLAGARFLHEPN